MTASLVAGLQYTAHLLAVTLGVGCETLVCNPAMLVLQVRTS